MNELTLAVGVSREAPGAADVFDEIAGVLHGRRVLAARQLGLVARAADEYEVVDADLFDDSPPLDAALVAGQGRERWVQVGADGTPHVGEFLAVELAGLFGSSVPSAKMRIAEALNLRHRHPRLWEAVHGHHVEAWQALKVVDECVTAGLGLQECLAVDGQFADAVGLLGWGRARRLLKGLIVRADPGLAAHRAEQRRLARGVWASPIIEGQVCLEARLDGGDGVLLEAQVARIAELLLADGDTSERQHRRATALAMLAIPHLAAAYLEDHATPTGAPDEDPVRRVDPDRLRPRATLIVHVHADDLAGPDTNGVVPEGSGVARIEGHGPIAVDSFHHVLRGAHVTVRPVVDLNGPPVVDAYEVPDRLRDHVIARNPVEVFPWSARPSRSCQLDHTESFDHDDWVDRAQTHGGNLGPLGSTVHRAKTHALYGHVQLEPGLFWWRTPAGFAYLITPNGTHPLGRAPRGDPDREIGGRGRRPRARPETRLREGPQRPPPPVVIPGQEGLGPDDPPPY